MEKLKTNDLLRYAFSGGITLFLLYLLCKSHIPFFEIKNEFINATFIGVFALLIGSLIYTIHRAILYPIVYRITQVLLCFSKRYPNKFDPEMLILWRPTKLELKTDIERWKRRKNKRTLQDELTEWGSQIHFLLTTCWGMFIVLIICDSISDCYDFSLFITIHFIAWSLLVASFITLLRHLIYEKASMNIEFNSATKTFSGEINYEDRKPAESEAGKKPESKEDKA